MPFLEDRKQRERESCLQLLRLGLARIYSWTALWNCKGQLKNSRLRILLLSEIGLVFIELLRLRPRASALPSYHYTLTVLTISALPKNISFSILNVPHCSLTSSFLINPAIIKAELTQVMRFHILVHNSSPFFISVCLRSPNRYPFVHLLSFCYMLHYSLKQPNGTSRSEEKFFQKVFRIEDRNLFCVVGILHEGAVSGFRCRRSLLLIWTTYLLSRHTKVALFFRLYFFWLFCDLLPEMSVKDSHVLNGDEDVMDFFFVGRSLKKGRANLHEELLVVALYFVEFYALASPISFSFGTAIVVSISALKCHLWWV